MACSEQCTRLQQDIKIPTIGRKLVCVLYRTVLKTFELWYA